MDLIYWLLSPSTSMWLGQQLQPGHELLLPGAGLSGLERGEGGLEIVRSPAYDQG